MSSSWASITNADPATLTEDKVRAYFLFLRQEKKFGGSVQRPRYHAVLKLIYGAGLRVSGAMSGGLSSVSLVFW